ncbi:hypothetical protein P9209_29845 [Prescottella defluvii]|nr:hypothetical protein P9209_29845 [Prescottella defluvii]
MGWRLPPWPQASRLLRPPQERIRRRRRRRRRRRPGRRTGRRPGQQLHRIPRGGAVAAAFDAGLPVVEAFGTQKPPWYSAPTVFYRIVDDRAALSSPSTKFVVLGQRPPDTFAVAPGPFGRPGLAGPIATWDPRGVDPNVRWSFAATACAGTARGRVLQLRGIVRARADYWSSGVGRW